MWEVLLDTLIESALMLPFLLGAYLLIEYLEHHSGNWVQRLMHKSQRFSVPLGALLGCVPQCGFSVAVSNLYAGGLVSMGTLAAVYLSTSDEAVLLLAAHPEQLKTIGLLLGIKVVFAVLMGYLLDMVLRARHLEVHSLHNELCATCGCHQSHGGIFKPALRHTLKLFAFLLVVSTAVNVLVHWLGTERLGEVLLAGSVWQPVLAALLGFIPNCAVSVLLSELYLAGSLSFGALLSGLCTAAGMGVAVLLRIHRDGKKNALLLGYVYLAAVALGLAVQALGIMG